MSARDHEWSARHITLDDMVTLGDTTMRLSAWADALNVNLDYVQTRLASGDMVLQALRPNRASRESVELRFENDPGVRDFVEAHPDGADRETIGRFFGLSRERMRQIETVALRKYHEALGSDEPMGPQTRERHAAKTARLDQLVKQGVGVETITERLGIDKRTVHRARMRVKKAS